MKLVDEHSFIFTLRSARVKEDKNGAGFITLLLDVLLVVGLILFLIIELLKNNYEKTFSNIAYSCRGDRWVSLFEQ